MCVHWNNLGACPKADSGLWSLSQKSQFGMSAVGPRKMQSLTGISEGSDGLIQGATVG